eukprot:177435_1
MEKCKCIIMKFLYWPQFFFFFCSCFCFVFYMASEPEESPPQSEHSRTILHEGYLHKKGQINRSWKKRYFVLYSDKKLAYFNNEELSNNPPIHEVNLSTVLEVSLLPFGKKVKKSRGSLSLSTKSFADLFSNKTPTDSCTAYSLNTNHLIDYDDEEEEEEEEDPQGDEYQHHDLYVDAPMNTQHVCSRRHAFDLTTDKRDYWLCCSNSQELNEWIIHLKYAIFGKLIWHGYLSNKTKKKLKTKWKGRYIQIYESKILRVYKNEQAKKVKQQIDLNALCISKIQSLDTSIDAHPFPIQIYDADGLVSHIFSAKSEAIRDECMNALDVTMTGKRCDVLFEGCLYFRPKDVKCWEKSYFALVHGSLLRFKDAATCKAFENCIYSKQQFYDEGLNAFVIESIALNDAQIEKKDYTEIETNDDDSTWLELLKIFVIKTDDGTWYFATEEATALLSWCQSLLSLKKGDRQRSATNESKFASTEAMFLMHINTNLSALNESFHDGDEEEEEEEEKSIHQMLPKLDKKISMKAMMAVNLDAKPMERNTVRAKSVQFTPFTEKELQFIMGNSDIDDSYKDSLENNYKERMEHSDEDYVYTTTDDESDRDCLESMTNASYYHRVRRATCTETRYIVDDDDEDY